VQSKDYNDLAYITREDLNFLTSCSKIKPPFVIVEAPDTTRVDYYIPKMTNSKSLVRANSKKKEEFNQHINDYMIIVESKRKINMFMAEKFD
jgi:hypothetical protein